MPLPTCGKCGESRLPLFCTGPLGTIPAGWRCWGCLTPEQRTAIDPMVKDVTDAIDTDGKGDNEG